MPEAPNKRFWPAAVMTASKHLAVPIGGSRVATVTSDRHAARLTFQSEAILNAE
jgi:hypothetical protein